jgi:hypothetical protein
MRKTGAKEVEAVLRLDGPARFEHFIKRVVDEERAWGLWKDGWALMQNNDGTHAFPLWPAKEYAELARSGDWAEYETESISLNDLVEELLPKLAKKGVIPAVFPTPNGKGVAPSIEEFITHLKVEQKKYE